MPTYDYKCKEHGYFEKQQRMVDHASAECPQCGDQSVQVMTRAPGLDIEAMADVGMPGAFHTSGDRITKRHKDAGQDWVAPDHW
jgi:putative FmdB family regulatory protein